jgi:ribulose 1,5-bisphosphate synthetase/thiazole synthase
MQSTINLAGSIANTRKVDLLIIGAGPASLGLMISAVKQSKFTELLQDDGVAILDAGMSFGGGMLANYGINSNTSANSFLKCIFRKSKD